MFWDQLTTETLDAIDRSTPVILPTAATEQHGPHLPLSTDRLIGEHFCREFDREHPEAALILPTLAVACSAHHIDFAGSLSLTHETYLRQISEIIDSVCRHGFTRILLFNSHGGNLGANSVAADQLGHAHPDCRIATATWWKLDPQALAALNTSGFGGTGHACEFETSLLLHFAPELVGKIPQDLAPAPTFDCNTADMLHGSEATLYRTIREMNASGVVGTPSAATAETGAAITRIVTQRLFTILSDLSS